MTATRSIRWLFVDAVLSAWRADPELAGVQLEYGFPGADRIERESVYVAADSGDVSIPTTKAGRKHRDDQWKTTVVVSVLLPDGELGEAKARVEQIVGALCDTFADDPSIGGLDGLIDAEIGHQSGTTARLAEGAWSTVTLEIDAHARYQ